MSGNHLDREIAGLLGWIAIEPTSYHIDYPDDFLTVHHWRGIPPNGVFHENLPRWSADLNAQIWLCRSRGWNISYASGQPVVVQIRATEKHLYGASHPTNVWEAGAMAIYHALKEELRVSNPVTE